MKTRGIGAPRLRPNARFFSARKGDRYVREPCVGVIGFRLMHWGDRLGGGGHTWIFTNADDLGFRLGSIANVNLQGSTYSHSHSALNA